MSASDEWLEGWEAIAKHVGVSERSAKRYATFPMPLPVVKFRHRTRANVGALNDWIERNTRPVNHR